MNLKRLCSNSYLHIKLCREKNVVEMDCVSCVWLSRGFRTEQILCSCSLLLFAVLWHYRFVFDRPLVVFIERVNLNVDCCSAWVVESNCFFTRAEFWDDFVLQLVNNVFTLILVEFNVYGSTTIHETFIREYLDSGSCTMCSIQRPWLWNAKSMLIIYTVSPYYVCINTTKGKQTQYILILYMEAYYHVV